MLKAIYNFSQEELYELGSLIALSLEEDLTDFANYKALYTAGYVADLKTKVTNARNLPDSEQRLEQQRMAYEALKVFVEGKIHQALNYLKGYIRTAYTDPTQREIQLTAAGFNEYDKAMKLNWESVTNIMNKAVIYTDSHNAQLIGGDNMPVTFPPALTSLRDAVLLDVSTFYNLRDNSEQGTQLKIEANNDLYATLSNICADGQIVYIDNEAKRDQYVVARLLDLITPPGAAGLKLDVKNSVTNEWVAGAQVKIMKDGEPVISSFTDADGKADMGNLTAGTYVGNITCAGYAEFNFEVVISTGVTSYKHYVITQIVPPTPDN
jgi:hypothetical protein